MPVILAPPGSGKTYWVQSHPEWHDMDILYCPKYHSLTWSKREHKRKETIEKHYTAIDEVVERDRLSKNIVGSLFWKLVPDAIVILDERLHRRYVKSRSGAEVLPWENAERIRNVLLDVAKEHKVPVFNSFDQAAAHVNTV